MGFIEANGHDPCSQEGKPSDGDHHPDLELCQLMGKAIDINEPHVGGHTLQGCYCQPASKECFFYVLGVLNEFSLPQVKTDHYQEVNGLLDHSGLMSDFLPSLGLFVFL